MLYIVEMLHIASIAIFISYTWHLRVKCYPLLPGPIMGTLFASVRNAIFSAISFLFPILLQQTFFVIVCHTSFCEFLSTPTVGLAESAYSKFLKAALPYQPMLRRKKLLPTNMAARTSARLRQKPRDPTGLFFGSFFPPTILKHPSFSACTK